ncbi:hypothetical protein TWF281_000937 [Arthrobotrys megalospora]
MEALNSALQLFPNARNLYISYETPTAAQYNIYAAILSNLSPSLCNVLQRLDIQVYRRIGLQYDVLYSKLSAENQRFLGEVIPYAKVEEFLQSITPKLPALISFGITSDIPNPLEIGKRFETSVFYYIPILSAPKLENLRVRAGGRYNGLNDFFRVHQLKPNGPSDLDVKLFDRFAQLKSLKFTIFRSLFQSDIKNLWQRCPNLEVLEITPFDENRAQYYESRYDNIYEDIGQLKRLTEFVLPWPDFGRQGFENPKTLEKWVMGWLKSGMDNLRVARFDGIRYIKATGDLYNTPDPIKLLVYGREDSINWGLKVEGDTEDYESTHGRYY